MVATPALGLGDSKLPRRAIAVWMDVYEVRPRRDKRGVNLISDTLPFGRLCGTMNQTQSGTRSSTAANMMP
jgi:hypothetical protein